MLALFLRTRVRRLAILVAFGLLFVAAGLTARLMVGTENGHVEMGQLFLVGGYPLASALMLLGWLIGRYPLIATLALMAGVVSDDRVSGVSRLYAVRPTSLIKIYLSRFGVVALMAFLLSALLLPSFDFMMLSDWAGYATLILIASYVAVYGSLCFLLSVWFRSDVWITLLLAIAGMLWDALLRSGKLAQAAPGIRQAVAVILPPQGALFQIEGAFGALQPVPWMSVAYVMVYAAILLTAAAVSLKLREY